MFAENPRSQQAAIVYGAWREAADTNKINWPVPVLLVRLPGVKYVIDIGDFILLVVQC